MLPGTDCWQSEGASHWAIGIVAHSLCVKGAHHADRQTQHSKLAAKTVSLESASSLIGLAMAGLIYGLAFAHLSIYERFERFTRSHSLFLNTFPFIKFFISRAHKWPKRQVANKGNFIELFWTSLSLQRGGSKKRLENALKSFLTF